LSASASQLAKGKSGPVLARAIEVDGTGKGKFRKWSAGLLEGGLELVMTVAQEGIGMAVLVHIDGKRVPVAAHHCGRTAESVEIFLVHHGSCPLFVEVAAG